MPWSVVILVGGGFALARATEVSGFSNLFTQYLETSQITDYKVIIGLSSMVTMVATEFLSNVTNCSILLPILRDLVGCEQEQC